MKLLSILSIAPILFILGQVQSANAACTTQYGGLSPDSTILNGSIPNTPSNGVYWPNPNPPAKITGYSLVDCSLDVPSFSALKTSWFYAGYDGSNIDVRTSKNIAGRTYYKIKQSSDAFADEYGYITFRIQDTGSGPGPLEINPNGNNIFNKVSNQSSTQGINILDLKIFFDRAPTTAINISNLRLGALFLTLERSGKPTVTQGQYARVSFNYAPPPRPTCDVTSQNVKLATITTNALKNTGDEAALTRFTVTATCPMQAAGQMLEAKMQDNTEISNNGLILTNSNKVSNVGLKIYDQLNNKPIQFNQYFDYGRFDTAVSTRVLKNFYVKYYKTNANPTVAGPVNGQATISVVYK
ncbi:type 1 fimbria pilin [Acinetobacter calcoaceticus]|uniref:Type 1 fimbria pilin n=1 Tax=Acinetobacter calcoaceticus TaxID=471 RepID=A0A4R1Y214_ACICA|nr:type 1 fimbria pilin [Acinetobacter calcoaceticus]